MKNHMNATVEISGVGRVFVRTSLPRIKIAGDVASDGTPVHLVEKRVSDSIRHAAKALKPEAAGWHLRCLSTDESVFVLEAPTDNQTGA